MDKMDSPSRGRTVAYWIATALVIFAFAAGGVMDILRPEELLKTMTHLGYPEYFCVILGTWKVLGAIAVLIPGARLIKEWAYAGMFFDLSGAAISHASVGDGAMMIATPLVVLVFVIASWALRPVSRRLLG